MPITESAIRAPELQVQDFITAVHAQIREENQQEGKRNPRARDFARMRGAFDQVYRMRNLVGRMPPRPDTLRARVGAVLVRLLQRLLFWYTPQIIRFHCAATSLLDALCSSLERQSILLHSYFTHPCSYAHLSAALHHRLLATFIKFR